jgi:hypothetical protein
LILLLLVFVRGFMALVMRFGGAICGRLTDAEGSPDAACNDADPGSEQTSAGMAFYCNVET